MTTSCCISRRFSCTGSVSHSVTERPAEIEWERLRSVRVTPHFLKTLPRTLSFLVHFRTGNLHVNLFWTCVLVFPVFNRCTCCTCVFPKQIPQKCKALTYFHVSAQIAVFSPAQGVAVLCALRVTCNRTGSGFTL